MNLTVQYKCNEFRSQIEDEITRSEARLERRLEHYNSDLVSLHACYNRHPRKRDYLITLNLSLPGATLHASASHSEPRFALCKAFDEIEAQISKYQRRLRKDYEWKRRRPRRPATAEA